MYVSTVVPLVVTAIYGTVRWATSEDTLRSAQWFFFYYNQQLLVECCFFYASTLLQSDCWLVQGAFAAKLLCLTV